MKVWGRAGAFQGPSLDFHKDPMKEGPSLSPNLAKRQGLSQAFANHRDPPWDVEREEWGQEWDRKEGA